MVVVERLIFSQILELLEIYILFYMAHILYNLYYINYIMLNNIAKVFISSPFGAMQKIIADLDLALLKKTCALYRRPTQTHYGHCQKSRIKKIFPINCVHWEK